MATRIKGITIEFDGNTVKLQNALKEVNRMTAETQRGLKDVSRLLKIDLGNTSLLAQNVEVLTDQVQNTKLKLNELNTAYDKLKENGVDENSTEIQALYREIIDMGNRLKTLEKQLQSFGSVGAQKITAACVKVKEMGSKINKTKATVKVGNTY